MTTLQIKTSPIFEPLLAPSRYKGAFGGRASGKSHFFAELAIERCIMNPGTRIVCVREVQKSLKESVKRLLEDKIISMGVGASFNILYDSIITPGGGVIIFEGLVDHTAESIKSLEGFDIGYAEEAQTLTTRSLELFIPTIIRKILSELWFSWNPRDASDPVDLLLRGSNLPGNAVVVNSNWRDNTFLTDESESVRAYDEINKPDRYAHIWEGEYEPQAIGAIWTRDVIQRNRIEKVPAMKRILIGIDPPTESGENSDKCGLIAAGMGADGHGYVLQDESKRATPEEWGRTAVAMYDLHEADAIVAEVNQGGDMVRSVIHSIRSGLKVIKVRAKRGKHIRAEPVSALYSLNRISHVGNFPELERQMCVEEGTLIETDRGQVPIEDVTLKDMVMTRNGFASLRWSGCTGTTSDLIEIKTANSTLRTTRCHPIYLPETNEFVSAGSVSHSHHLLQSKGWGNMENQSHGVVFGGTGKRKDIRETHSGEVFSIARYMRSTLALSLKTWKSIIKITTLPITNSQTLTQGQSIAQNIQKPDLIYTPELSSRNVSYTGLKSRAFSARKNDATAQIHAPKECTVEERKVYNLSVSEGYLPEYFANGILTHNCLMTAEGYEGSGSPDNVDACVYIFLELFNKMTGKSRPEGLRPVRATNQYRPHDGLNRGAR